MVPIVIAESERDSIITALRLGTLRLDTSTRLFPDVYSLFPGFLSEVLILRLSDETSFILDCG